jgi:hypothetical protein
VVAMQSIQIGSARRSPDSGLPRLRGLSWSSQTTAASVGW